MRDLRTPAGRRSLACWLVAGVVFFTAFTWASVAKPYRFDQPFGSLLHLPATATALAHGWVLETVAREPSRPWVRAILLAHTVLWGGAFGLGARALVLGRDRSSRWPRPWLGAVLVGTVIVWLPFQVRLNHLPGSGHHVTRSFSPCDYTKTEHWRRCQGCPYRNDVHAVLVLPARLAWEAGGFVLFLLAGPLLGLLGLAGWRAWQRRPWRRVPVHIRGVRT